MITDSGHIVLLIGLTVIIISVINYDGMSNVSCQNVFDGIYSYFNIITRVIKE